MDHLDLTSLYTTIAGVLKTTSDSVRDHIVTTVYPTAILAEPAPAADS